MGWRPLVAEGPLEGLQDFLRRPESGLVFIKHEFNLQVRSFVEMSTDSLPPAVDVADGQALSDTPLSPGSPRRGSGGGAVTAKQNREFKSSIYKIVLTGGPCAGKTTALDRLAAYLRERGFRVFTVPEAATMIFSNGVGFDDLDHVGFPFEFQKAVLATQLHLEDTFMNLAGTTGESSVLLCDRGTCDGKAYVNKATWEELLATRSLDSEVELREGRYNAVFHLVTAAAGAEPFYTLANNMARRESAPEAIMIDEKTQQAVNYSVLRNHRSVGFEQHR